MIISFWANNTSKSADFQLKFGVGPYFGIPELTSEEIELGRKILVWFGLGLPLKPLIISFWANNTPKSADFELKFGLVVHS